MPTPTDQQQQADAFHPVAAILALLLPGLGHWSLGHRARAVRIAAGVLGLFFGGVFIGGIDAIDRREDLIWFIGQSLVGPVAWGTDTLHQNLFKVRDAQTGQPRSANPGEARNTDASRGPIGAAVEARPGERPPSSKSLGRVNELGTLFSAVAGMMNLIAIIDAAFRHRLERDPVHAAPRSPTILAASAGAAR